MNASSSGNPTATRLPKYGTKFPKKTRTPHRTGWRTPNAQSASDEGIAAARLAIVFARK